MKQAQVYSFFPSSEELICEVDFRNVSAKFINFDKWYERLNDLTLMQTQFNCSCKWQIWLTCTKNTRIQKGNISTCEDGFRRNRWKINPFVMLNWLVKTIIVLATTVANIIVSMI